MTSKYTKGMPKSEADAEYADIRHTRYVPPGEHFATSQQEFAAMAQDPKSSRRTGVIAQRAFRETMPAGLDDIDWPAGLAEFQELAYPEYYLRPFHGVPGGWLSKRAAVLNRMFMQGIYKDAHPDSCMGLRRELSAMVPSDSRCVVDLGCGDGDGPACTARALPGASVIGVDASPFMLLAGRTQNAGLPNLRLVHALAEDTGLPDGCADCVTITLVFHECSELGKAAIAQEAKRLLKPGGVLLFADTPQDDLHTYIGAHEPYKNEWVHFKPEAFFTWLGFRHFEDRGVLGGTGKVVTLEEQRQLTGERTDNRLFVCAVRKAAVNEQRSSL